MSGLNRSSTIVSLGGTGIAKEYSVTHPTFLKVAQLVDDESTFVS